MEQIPAYILASKTKRFTNYGIDLITYKIHFWIFLFIAEKYFFDIQRLNIEYQYENFEMIEKLLVNSIGIFIYHLFYESLFGKTLSKLFTNTIIVSVYGSRPNFSNILIRSFVRSFPLEYCTFLNGRKLGWHDKFSNTYVVDIEKLNRFKYFQ